MITRSIIASLTNKARVLKKDALALYLAYQRPDVPWYAKVLAILVVGYALSPVDLIPDFIPVLGYLDDLLLLPLGIYLVARLVPEHVMVECRLLANEKFKESRPRSLVAGFLIIVIWGLAFAWLVIKIFKWAG